LEIYFPDQKISKKFTEFCLNSFNLTPVTNENNTYLVLKTPDDRDQALEIAEKLGGKIIGD